MNWPYSDWNNPKTISQKVYLYSTHHHCKLSQLWYPFQTICYLIHKIPQNSQRADNPLSTSIRAGTPRHPKSISHRNHIPVPKRAAVSPELLAPLETFRLIIRHPSRFGFTYLVRIRALAMGPGIRSNYLKFLFGATVCVCVFVWISNFRSLHQWYMRCCVVFSVHFSFFFGGNFTRHSVFLFFFIRCHLASALDVLFPCHIYTVTLYHTYCHVLASHVSVGHPQIYAFYWIECIMVFIDFMYDKHMRTVWLHLPSVQ